MTVQFLNEILVYSEIGFSGKFGIIASSICSCALISFDSSDVFLGIAKFESNPFRSFYIKGAQIKYNWPIFQMKRSQDLRDLYYDTGSFYIYRTRTLIKIRKKKNLPTKTTFIILKKKLIDINYPEDLNELKFLIKKNN